MQPATFLAAQLARICYLDGHQEGLNGMMAVGFTIRNRVRAGWHGGDWSAILSHHRDWAATEDIFPDTVPNTSSYAFQTLLQEIDGIFSGNREDDVTIAKDSVHSYIRQKPQSLSLVPAPAVALYYAPLNLITRPWFEQTICHSDQHKIVAQVGLLHFWT